MDLMTRRVNPSRKDLTMTPCVLVHASSLHSAPYLALTGNIFASPEAVLRINIAPTLVLRLKVEIHADGLIKWRNI